MLSVVFDLNIITVGSVTESQNPGDQCGSLILNLKKESKQATDWAILLSFLEAVLGLDPNFSSLHLGTIFFHTSCGYSEKLDGKFP